MKTWGYINQHFITVETNINIAMSCTGKSTQKTINQEGPKYCALNEDLKPGLMTKQANSFCPVQIRVILYNKH